MDNKFNKIFSNEIEEIPNENRVLRFVTSTEAQDRDGDIIEVDGWDIKNYLKNPVVLFGHDYTGLPVGKTVNIEKDSVNKKLIQDIQFPTKDEYEFADTVYRLAKSGYLKTTSVGFIGTDFENILDDKGNYLGRRYKKQELLETSIVPVPSNPEALIEARSKGIINDEELKLFENKEDKQIKKESAQLGDNTVLEDKSKEEIIEKIGASLSAKNKEILMSIHSDLTKCHNRLTKFLNPCEPDMGEDMGDNMDEDIEKGQKKIHMKGVDDPLLELDTNIKQEEIQQSKEPEDIDIDLESLVDDDEINISGDELEKALDSILDKKINQLKGGN